MKIRIDILRDNPLNQKIYGDDDEKQFNELVEKIKKSGWIKAILVTNDYLIVSGHRRVKAARSLGFDSIECEIITSDPEKQAEIFLNENAYRLKSNTQLLREAELYFDIEKKKAHERQIQAEKIVVNNDLLETFPEGHVSDSGNLLPLIEKGNTRDIVAKKIGMSGRSYDKGRKFMEHIDEELDPELKEFMIAVFNENIDCAARLIEKPYGFIKEVKDRTYIDLKNIGKVIHQLEREETISKTHLPPGKYQVLYCDLTNTSSYNLSKLPISEIGEADSVLFLWTTPSKLSMALELIKTWGFHYKTCMIWYKDVFEISDKAEILTISTRGNPPMISQSDESDSKTEKPELVMEMISATYSGTKIELTFGDSDLNGWKMWS